MNIMGSHQFSIIALKSVGGEMSPVKFLLRIRTLVNHTVIVVKTILELAL